MSLETIDQEIAEIMQQASQGEEIDHVRLGELNKEREALIAAQNKVKEQSAQTTANAVAELCQSTNNQFLNNTGVTKCPQDIQKTADVSAAINASESAKQTLLNNINGDPSVGDLVNKTTSAITSPVSAATDVLNSTSSLASGVANGGRSNMVNALSTKISDITNGITDGINNAVNSVVGSLTDMANNAVSSALGALSGAGDMFGASKAIGTATQFAHTLADKASGAVDALNGIADKACNTISTVAGSALDNSVDMTSKVGTLAKDASEKFNEMANGIEGNSSAKGTEVKTAFKTSANKSGVNNALLPAAELGANLTSLKDKAFSKFAELAGPVTTLKNAVSNVRNSVVGMVQGVTGIGAKLAGTINSSIHSVISPITSTISAVTSIADPNNVKNIVSATLGELPFGVDKIIGNSLSNKYSKAMEGVFKKVNKVESMLYGIDGVSDTIKNVLDKSATEDTIFNSAGEIITGVMSGRIDDDDFKRIYERAAEVCPNITTIDNSNYEIKKLVYNTLLQEAMNKSYANLMKQLLMCPEMVDDTTEELIASNLTTLAQNGDAISIRVATKAVDVKRFIKSEKEAADLVRSLCTNAEFSKTNPKINEEITKAINEVADILGVTPESLAKDDEIPEAYSPTNMAYLMRNKNVADNMKLDTDKMHDLLSVSAQVNGLVSEYVVQHGRYTPNVIMA